MILSSKRLLHKEVKMSVSDKDTIRLVCEIVKRRKADKVSVSNINKDSDLVGELNFESLEVAELLIGLEEIIGHELNPFDAQGQLRKIADFTNLANS